EIGADWMVTDRLTLRPEILYQSQWNANGVIAGNEFCYNVSKKGIHYKATSVFAGAWYHTGNAMMITSGVAFKSVQIGISYDFNSTPLYYSGYGSGGFAISIKYIAQGHRSMGNRTI